MFGFHIRYVHDDNRLLGHYGAPQSRVRFFLIAAKRGLPLPELPQPTHAFPVVDSLRIRVPYGAQNGEVLPIRTVPGTAPCPMVTIEDAIGDLKRWE
jgi:DNA (cytosine-5)-methyltransferase 1